MKFADLNLSSPILRAVADQGYTDTTPIQELTIPHVLQGRDVLGCAQTGTGKTAAFALPILHRLAQEKAPRTTTRTPGRNFRPNVIPRCLVLCPTRELARQIAESFNDYGQNLSLNGTMIFGGVNQTPQVNALRRGVDIIIATPGRLMDLMNQGCVNLSAVRTLVLDEADRMLDMGFIKDIERIVAKLPYPRQTLLFSATMPPEIRQLANRLLTNPATVEVSPETPTVEAVDQSVFFVQKKDKPALLRHLLEKTAVSRALVFTRTKHGADRVARHLRTLDYQADAIHGNKSQNARERALRDFTTGRIHVLVATDIAARGLDVDGISHVINFDLSHEPETYIHRIGRTARAGASGCAISFCDSSERAFLKDIQKLIRQQIPVRTDAPNNIILSPTPTPQDLSAAQPRTSQSRNSRPAPRPKNTAPGQGIRRRRRRAARQKAAAHTS